MKYIYIIILILLITGCTQYVPVVETITETVVETVVVTEIVVEYDNECSEELQQYKDLISNLNEYLGYVYLIEVSNSNYSSEGIGFTIEYEDEFYMITAGHGVHYVYEDYDILYTNFRFKPENIWIQLELLVYENDYINKEDYAIFTSSEIEEGFKVDLDDDNPLYRIGDTIVDYRTITIEGESGSPVIDIDGEITEISTTDYYSYNTDIDIVLEAINLNKKE